MVCGVQIGRYCGAWKMGKLYVRRAARGICGTCSRFTAMAIGLAARAARIRSAVPHMTRRLASDTMALAHAWLLRRRVRLPCVKHFARCCFLAAAQGAVISGAYALGVALRVATTGQ